MYPVIRPRPRRERGQGSGFVMDGAPAMVVTNAHVVQGASRVKVTLPDGRIFQGLVQGVDEFSDLAVVS